MIIHPKNNTLIFRFIGWFYLFNAVLFCLAGHTYLKNILFSPLLFENTVVQYTTLYGKIFVLFFALVNYCSYMVVLAFIPALFVFLLAYVLPKKPLVFCVSVLSASVCLMLLIINNYVYSLFKFHLNSTILGMIFNEKYYEVFDLSNQEFGFLLLVFWGILFLESAIAFFVWKKIILTRRYLIGGTIASLSIGGIFFSYFTLIYSLVQNYNILSQQITNLPLYTQFISYLIPEENAREIFYRYNETHFNQPFFSNEPLNYPLNSMRCTKPTQPLNVIMIMVDSLRYDAVQTQYMPHVTQFAQKSWQFHKHLSGGNSTQPGLFSLFYSIPSTYWTAALEQKVAPVFIKLLLRFGYVTQILWSSELYIPPFDKTIYLGIQNVNPKGSPGDDIGERDRYITAQAINFLENNHRNTPFFLNLFYDAPHGYCREQSFPTPHQPAIRECSRIKFMSPDTAPQPYYNRYLNSVHFVDNEIAKILERIEELGYLKNSVVIITSDHGQEFNDNKQNYWEHASNYTNAQVQIPLIIHWPNQDARSITYLTSSYDIIPTLLKRLYSCENPISDYSIGQDLLTNKNRKPFILAGSYSNVGLIEPDCITTLRATGDIVITNEHAEPIPNAKPNMVRLEKALKLMRHYFERD